jgi:hypothetical protein
LIYSSEDMEAPSADALQTDGSKYGRLCRTNDERMSLTKRAFRRV